MNPLEQIWLTAMLSACGLGIVLALYVALCAWRRQRRDREEMRRYLRKVA